MGHLSGDPKANLVILGDFHEGHPVGSDSQALDVLFQAKPLVDALSTLSGKVATHTDGKAYDRILVSDAIASLIDSGVVPVVRLTEVFRQAAHSRIITTAHRINEGLMPEMPAKDAESDFYFIDREEPEQIAATLVEMVKTRIPAKFGFDPIRDIQVLCPMNRGSLGIRELNVRLQSELNPARPDEPVVEKFGWQFRVRDKVIQTENNYDKDVFNGDIGQIVKIDPVEREVTVRFDQREVVYDFGELDEVALAYAITIHKSQGSEFPAVVIPLAMQQYLREDSPDEFDRKPISQHPFQALFWEKDRWAR